MYRTRSVSKMECRSQERFRPVAGQKARMNYSLSRSGYLMKNNAALVSVLAALAVLPCLASAQSFERYYKAILPRMVRSLETGDVKFFDAISTPDFTEKGPDETRNKAQAMDAMSKQFALMKKLTCKVRPISVKSMGSKATVVVWMRSDIVLEDQHHKPHTLIVETTEAETWVKTDSIWRIKTMTQSKPSKMTMDGKSINRSTPAKVRS